MCIKSPFYDLAAGPLTCQHRPCTETIRHCTSIDPKPHMGARFLNCYNQGSYMMEGDLELVCLT